MDNTVQKVNSQYVIPEHEQSSIHREENLIETNTKRILQASVHKHLQGNLISDDFPIHCWLSTRTEPGV